MKYPNVHDAVDDLMDRLLIEANEKQKENAIWQGKKKQELKTISVSNSAVLVRILFCQQM